MHFYEILCFLKIGYIWNRQQCGDISSIYVKRYLFGRCPVWELVVRRVDLPDSGIWMVCYQVWWSEIGCCRLVVGTVRQVRMSGRLAAVWCPDVSGGSTGMVGCYQVWCYKKIIIIWCWCMVWWGVSAVSGSNERMLSDSKRQIPRITARESQESSIQNYTKIWKQFVTRMGFEPMTLTLKV